jgi:opacity protein-like surface antigen
MKLILISLFISITAININAQILSNYGIKLGADITNQSWDYKNSGNVKWDNITTVSPRIFAEINLSPIQIEGELGYSRKGFETSIPVTTVTNPDGTGESYMIKNQLNYLNFSLAGKYSYAMGVFAPYVIAGPQLNLLINKNTDKYMNIIFDNYKKYNVGVSLGLGTEVKGLLPVALLIEYRYETDFINNYNTDDVNIKNYSHVVLLGVRF